MKHHSLINRFAAFLSFSVAAHFNSAFAQIEEAALTESAFAVLSIKLDQIDDHQIQQLVGANAEQSRAAILKARLAQLQSLGVDRLHLVMGWQDLSHNLGYFVVSAPNPKSADAVHAVIRDWRNQPFERSFVKDSNVYCGSSSLEDGLSRATSSDRHLHEPMPQTKDFRFRYVPSQIQRRVISEQGNNLSHLFGKISGKDLASIESLTVDFNIDQSYGAMICQVGDADAATHLAAGLSQLVKSLGMVIPGSRETTFRISDARATDNIVRGTVAFGTGFENIAEGIRKTLWMVPRRDVLNNLKHVGLAMHNFYDQYSSFPPSASFDDTGKPLLSWRVHLLPYLGRRELYEKFRLDEPWDSEHNVSLIREMPEFYAPDSIDLLIAGKTTIVVPVGVNTAFHQQVGVSFKDMIDGTSNTLMIVDVAPEKAVVWTRPADLNIDAVDLSPALFGQRDVFAAALCDGAARYVPNTISIETLKNLLYRNDKNAIGPF